LKKSYTEVKEETVTNTRARERKNFTKGKNEQLKTRKKPNMFNLVNP
jgi:hypothetical protein